MNQQSLLVRALVFYGSQLPYHRGKGWMHERLVKLFRVHVDQDIDIERNGLRWRLNPADFVQADVFWLGRKEYYDVYHLQRMVRPGDVLLDIGANFGYYAIVLAYHLKKQCEVHAFEPNPCTLKQLRHHVEINGLMDVIHIHDLALGDNPGTASLATKTWNSGGTHVVPFNESSTSVQVTTLDDFCNDQGLTRLDVIKIDVEGFEERVLLGGQRTLRRWEPLLLLELEPARLHDKNSSVERVAAMLNEFGYELFISCRNNLVPLLELPTGDDVKPNIFCLPRGKRALLARYSSVG